MRHVKYLLVVLFFFFTKTSYAEADSLGYKYVLGFAGGISQYNNFSADIYFGFPISMKNGQMDLNIGYTHFKNQTNFDGVKDLLFSSHGIYVDANFLLSAQFYTGFRFAVNGNWVDKASQEEYDQSSSRKPPTYFSGLAWLGYLGFNQALGSHLSLRLQTQLGLQNYKIANGSLLFSNSNTPTTASYTEEKRIKFLYNLSLGVHVRI
jgi:hypothetical protein